MEDVYFSHKEGAGGALTHQGDNLTGEGDGACVCECVCSCFVYVCVLVCGFSCYFLSFADCDCAECRWS